MKKLLLIPVFLFSIAFSQDSDKEAIENTINQCLEILSGQEGEEKNWETWLGLFTPSALMNSVGIKNEMVKVNYRTVKKFMKMVKKAAKTGSFYEYQIDVKVTNFANIAQAWQVYGIKFEKNGEEKRRGINAYQLIKIDGKWLIDSIVWQNETEDHKVEESLR